MYHEDVLMTILGGPRWRTEDNRMFFEFGEESVVNSI